MVVANSLASLIDRYFEQAVDEGLPLAAADVEVISDADLGASRCVSYAKA